MVLFIPKHGQGYQVVHTDCLRSQARSVFTARVLYMQLEVWAAEGKAGQRLSSFRSVLFFPDVWCTVL